MILRRAQLDASGGRCPYPLPEDHRVLEHFVARETLPGNPFAPHVHDEEELWYIQEGEAVVSLGGKDESVQAGDLIVIRPGVEHGLRTDSRVVWLCLA